MARAGNQIAKVAYGHFANEGDLLALNEFHQIFPGYMANGSKAKKDWEIAGEGKKLMLEDGYKPGLENDYKAFIRKAAPKEVALAALEVWQAPKS